MTSTFGSRYLREHEFVDGGRLALEAGALLAELDRLGTNSIVAAVRDRSRLAVVVAAALASRRTVVFPHAFTTVAVARLADAAPGSLVVHDRDGADGLDLRRIVLVDRSGPDLAAALEATRNERLLVFMTSGTTGTPKPIGKTSSQLLDEAEALVARLGVAPRSSVALGVPSTHVYGFLFGIAIPSIVSIDVVDSLVRTPADLPETRAIDWFVGAPPTIRSFASSGGHAFAGTTVVSSGAELASAVRAEALASSASRVFEIFGSTETGGVGIRENADAAFAPLPHVLVDVEDDGKAFVRSPYASVDATAVALSDRLSVSGEGFRFESRDEDLVKVGGRRIAVSHVESILRAVPGVRDAAVRPRPSSPARGSRLAAIVDFDGTETRPLLDALARELDREFVPRLVVRVPRVPRGPSGKLALASFERALEDGRRIERAGLRVTATERDRFVASIPAGSSRFEGHFPGRPILPGLSILLDLVLPGIHAWHPDLGFPRRVARVKFVRTLVPGDEIVGALARDARDSIDFALETHDGAQVAKGRFHFGGES